MESVKNLTKEKLTFIGLLKESYNICCHNPKFIVLTFLTSLPLFCLMFIHELWFQTTLVKTTLFMSHLSDFHNMDDFFFYHYNIHPTEKLLQMLREFGYGFLQLGVMYLPFIHLPELISTITVVSSSSDIYSGNKIVTISDTLSKSLENGTFKRTLITSVYVLTMAVLIFLGLLAIASQMFVLNSDTTLTWSSFIFGLPIVVLLLYLYIQWSSVWNLGIVASILEEKRGDVAIGVSAYISRGNRRNGGIVTGVFFVWNMSLRLMSFIFMNGGNGDVRRGLLVVAVQVLLVCVGNVMKWVIFMVFFYDCKLRFLEKKVDVEEGKKADATTQGKTSEEAVDSSTLLLPQG